MSSTRPAPACHSSSPSRNPERSAAQAWTHLCWEALLPTTAGGPCRAQRGRAKRPGQADPGQEPPLAPRRGGRRARLRGTGRSLLTEVTEGLAGRAPRHRESDRSKPAVGAGGCGWAEAWGPGAAGAEAGSSVRVWAGAALHGLPATSSRKPRHAHSSGLHVQRPLPSPQAPDPGSPGRPRARHPRPHTSSSGGRSSAWRPSVSE